LSEGVSNDSSEGRLVHEVIHMFPQGMKRTKECVVVVDDDDDDDDDDDVVVVVRCLCLCLCSFCCLVFRVCACAPHHGTNQPQQNG
jgi:hypothetical protein